MSGSLKMGRRQSWVAGFVIALLVFVHGPSSSFVAAASAASPARMVNVFFSRVLSALLKWAWSLKSTTKTAISGRPMMRFESGYTVETVFDGSKLGIEPYSVEVSPTGELLVLDSVNSNIYRIPPSPSRYSRPKLVAGSAEGYSGHVDGRPREARMNHPKGFTVDDRGNIYVADAMNMAIRKISDTGVTTIAGGKWNRGHADGPSEDAKFSTDFEVVYIGSSCSLLVIDRGNQAIREIQLHFDDCAYQYGSGFPLGVAILLAACFFGYMLALLQRRVGVMVSSNNESASPAKPTYPPSSHKKLPKQPPVRPPLIPPEDDSERQDEGLFTSFGKLIGGAVSFVAELFGGISPRSRKKSNISNQEFHYQHPQQQRQPSTWPVQDSYVVPNEDEPPPLESKTPPRKTYAFMSSDTEKMRRFRQGRPIFGAWQGEPLRQQQILQQQRHYPLGPQTCYQQSCDAAKEIVFGAIQESDMRAPMEIKAVDHGDPMYGQGIRSRINYAGGYWHAY